MKTERISRALEALKATQAQRAYSKPQAAQAVQNNASGDAVKLSPGFGTSAREVGNSHESDATQRQAKLDKIKAAVNSGTYKVSSGDVAVSVIRDLGVNHSRAAI